MKSSRSDFEMQRFESCRPSQPVVPNASNITAIDVCALLSNAIQGGRRSARTKLGNGWLGDRRCGHARAKQVENVGCQFLSLGQPFHCQHAPSPHRSCNKGAGLGSPARSYCEPSCLSAGSITWIDQGQSSAATDLGPIDAANVRH